MALNAGLSKICAALNGGLKNIGIVPEANITTSNWAFAANGLVTSAEKVFYKFEFEVDTAEIRETSETSNGNVIYTQEIEFYLRGNNNDIRTALDDLQDDCGFVVVAEDRNGNIYLMGLSEDQGLLRPARLSSDAFTTGKDLADVAGSTVTLSCRTPKKFHQFGTNGGGVSDPAFIFKANLDIAG